MPKIPSQRILIYLQIAGFYNVTFLRGFKLVPGLITALVERWRPETHTFHFPFGECTITLQDVVMQLGVPINGNAVVGHDEYNVFELCDRLLGKAPSVSDVRGSRVKLAWLDNEFNVTEYSSEEEVVFAARASFAPAMFSTPPPMQQLDDQANEDEEASDHPHPRRTVRHPRRYDQTSSLHRQELPRRRR